MRNLLILSLSAVILSGCSGANQTTSATKPSNTPPPVSDANNLTVRSSRTSQTPPNSSSSSNSPMSRPVDVSELTAKIEQGEKDYKAKPNDAKVKETLAKDYFDRAFILTNAAQYRAAIGDFRKGLKLNPNDAKAKEMHDQIIDIFKSIGREPPKEGEEPAPLPFEKPKS